MRDPGTLARDWHSKLVKLFKVAGIQNGHAHRFRDTFAVEALLAGTPIEQVAALLGHSSIKMTERHYSPWVKARQEQMEASVIHSWELDPLIVKQTAGASGKGDARGTPKAVSQLMFWILRVRLVDLERFELSTS